MLEQIRKSVLKVMYKYHRAMGDYYFRKIDEYGPEYNDYWAAKINKHVDKELTIASELLAKEGF